MTKGTNHGVIAAIGTFDGVHRGHQLMIDALKSTAATIGCKPLVVTFTRHPLQLIAPDRAPKMLMSASERIEALRQTGVDVAVVDFDDDLRQLSALDFMRLLRDRYDVKTIYMGFNHHFGSDRLTDIEAYREKAKHLGIDIFRGEEAEIAGHKVSSSIIRQEIETGDVVLAAELLGRPYRVEGTVAHGKQLGRTIGFPTANLSLPDDSKLIPATGVYACRAILPDGRCYKAMVNIGVRPTVERGADRNIEAHLLDFNGDLYGKPVALEFVDRLRDEQRFESVSALAKQLSVDREKIDHVDI